jgi:hypothetical protein
MFVEMQPGIGTVELFCALPRLRKGEQFRLVLGRERLVSHGCATGISGDEIGVGRGGC